MRGALGVLALAVALAGCGSGYSGGGSSSPSSDSISGGSTPSGGRGRPGGAVCGPRAAPTLAASTAARVYVTAGVVYGCAAHGGKSYQLGARQTCLRAPRVQPVAVSGELAAYGLERCGVDTGSAAVVVTRLRDGRRLRSVAATTGPLSVESFQLVGSLVVRSDGAVAWIGAASSVVTHRTQVEVDRVDSRGQAMLDSGPGVALGSLRLRGSRLTWRHGGSVRTATLR